MSYLDKNKTLADCLMDVYKFNKFGKQDVSLEPRLISEEEFRKQKALIIEELNETEEALKAGDKIEVLDGLVDLLYVYLGLVNRFGMWEQVIKGFKVVHDNNMTKIFDPYGNNIAVFIKVIDQDGNEVEKIGKPEGYERVDLKAYFPELLEEGN